MSHSQAILVLGAGELGMPMLRHLAKRAAVTPGATVSVLLRPSAIEAGDPAKQQDIAELRALGIGIVAGDLAAEPLDALAARFAPFDTIVSCTGFGAGPGVQRRIAQAVLAAGVARYFPWQFGVDYDVIGRGSAQDLFDEQLDVRDLLRAQQHTEWVIVSTGMFTSFLFEPSFGVVDLARDTVHALGGWDNAVTVTTPEDIGRLTVEILFAEPRIANQVVYTAGETITYGRLADKVEQFVGRPLRRDAWTMPAMEAELAAQPDDTLRKYRVVFGAGRGVAWEMSRTFNAQRGFDALDVDGWMRQHLRVGVGA
ncbi:aromatic alcohol reductase [Paraburkholderia caballeronis]|uniref:NmrA-like family protein n=1 Tax=Paraburkholderia caballeronis TaxID=416943 RepID=A0A1H7G241_9BURK|nr:aromatic alcohol reductase [Paraburkholderia caballeronis]PXW24747.1 NmrA-like family protein [Paraburkholderia caballeronis]PXX00477.1 NmrA-like family protein [Paraburkholderia caballeronis]RAJ98540.1 NmrA-like family protein [Paraburkholderia caballeronis]SEE66388.1 NmrA-like family protein [Paraburkholderia caballeronis]SEK32124.1 NmrA-like family protein [Paraburkholderia caballeronis]